MTLAHSVWEEEGASPSRTAYFIHGIMGSQRNWRSFCIEMAKRHPDWRFVTIDLRNHGDSGRGDGDDTLAACAADIAALAEEIGAPDLVCGHSFGGKVALAHASLKPVGTEDYVILDCPPGRGDGAPDGELAKVLAAVDGLSMPVERRGSVVDFLMARGLTRGLANWMTTNLDKNEQGLYDWVFDLDGIRAMIADYWRTDFYPILEDPPRGMRFHLVRAGGSDRWSDEDTRRLAQLDAANEAVTVHDLPLAGHWLHVDDPEGLMTILAPIFER